MNKEVLDKLVPTLDDWDLPELVESHLCGLYVIKNKDRDEIKKEYGLQEDIEDDSREVLIEALYKMNEEIMKGR